MVNKKLSDQERREVILKSLQPDANLTQLAKEHGISRYTIYKYFPYVLDDPKRRLMEAEEEAAFRRKVWEMVS